MNLLAMPQDCCIVFLSYLSGLEFLRFNTVNHSLHALSSSNYLHLNTHWVSFLQLSDSIRAVHFNTKKPTYSPTIGREEAIALLRRRCQYCRKRTKYISEFTKARVCEDCEKEKSHTTFKMLSESMSRQKGLSEEQLSLLPSIERVRGRHRVTLYLATDIAAVLNSAESERASNSSSSEEMYWEDEEERKKKNVQNSAMEWLGSSIKRKKKKNKKRESNGKRKNERRQRRQHSSKRQPHWCVSHQSKASPSLSMNEEYDLAISGISCLMLHD